MKKSSMLFISILVCFCMMPNVVHGKTLNDMNAELEKLKEQQRIANSNKKLNQDELNKLNNEIYNIDVSIKQTEKDIETSLEDIEKSKQKIVEKKQETNSLLEFLQLSTSENVYLQYIFEAEDYTDMIYRYSVVKQLTSYNNDLLKQLGEIIEELNTKTQELNEKQKNLNSQKESLNSKLITLRANISKLTEEGTTIEEDIADLQKEINYYKKLGCNANQDITTCTSSPVAYGWSYPLKSGCVSSEYVGYGDRTDWSGIASGHHGIDLACNSEGTNVYPAAAGTVARIVWGSYCGGNQVWIYHTINGREYTTAYVHLLKIYVSVGQTVTKDQVIAAVGGGSTAASRGGYDQCTTGAHLHFGTATGHNAYNFSAYGFNPRQVLSFPAIYSGYFYR